LKNQQCHNKDCYYLHSIAKDSDLYPKDEMISNKIVFQKKVVMEHLKKYCKEVFNLNQAQLK